MKTDIQDNLNGKVSSKQIKFPVIFAGVFLLVLLVFAVILLGKKSKTLTVAPKPITTPATALDVTANWKTYTFSKLSFKYPSTWFAGISGDGTILLDSKPIESSNIVEPDQVAITIEEITDQKLIDLYANPQGNIDKKIINSIPFDYIRVSYVGGQQPKQTLLAQTKNNNILYRAGLSDVSMKSTFDQILSTFKFLNSENSISSAINPKKLPYALPERWRIVADKGNNFEIGYDPEIYSPIPATDEKYITLAYVKHPGSLDIALRPYNGGSRHQFIYDQLNYSPSDVAIEKSKDYYEKEYLVNNRSCLILYGLNFSASSNVWGMCAVKPDEAIFFAGVSSESINEEFIQAFRLLK